MFIYEGSTKQYEEAVEELVREFGRQVQIEGIFLEKHLVASNELTIVFDGLKADVTCRENSHFFRGVGILLQNMAKTGTQSFTVTEQIQFDSLGAMLDCSRSVASLENIKAHIRFMAACGMNILMLYTEDTYEVIGHPYFGAYRGRYSQEELKGLDDYAFQFGIEIIPCIQTLGHLRTVLRWPAFTGLRDTPDVLLVGSPKVEAFLTDLLNSATAPFRSKRIHLGMDEAHGLGLGAYLSENGYRSKSELMAAHLAFVQGICDDLGLDTLIWSDMFFRDNSPSDNYYDIPDDLDLSLLRLPNEHMHVVYWDYYHSDQATYRKFFNLHKQFDKACWFAGAAWTWTGPAPNYSKSFATTQAALMTCKSMEIHNAFCTMWGDNGAETPFYCDRPAFLFFAEHGYANDINLEAFKEKLLFLTGIPYEAWMLIDRMDTLTFDPERIDNPSNPTKYCLYQDLLIGLFDEQIKPFRLDIHYAALADALRVFSDKHVITYYYYTLARLLAIKATLGIRLQDSYIHGDKVALTDIVYEDIPSCIALMEKLKELRETFWYTECRPFGFECLDIRMGGVITRLQTAQRQIQRYLDGEIPYIGELLEPRLKFLPEETDTLPGFYLWEHIISAANISGV